MEPSYPRHQVSSTSNLLEPTDKFKEHNGLSWPDDQENIPEWSKKWELPRTLDATPEGPILYFEGLLMAQSSSSSGHQPVGDGTPKLTDPFKPPRPVAPLETAKERFTTGGAVSVAQDSQRRTSPAMQEGTSPASNFSCLDHISCVLHALDLTSPLHLSHYSLCPSLTKPNKSSDNQSEVRPNTGPGSSSKSQVDGVRVIWTKREEWLLSRCLNDLKRQSGTQNGFKMTAHETAAQFIAANGGRRFTARQCMQKFDRIKKRYRHTERVKNASGGGWDAATESPVFEAETGLLAVDGEIASRQVAAACEDTVSLHQDTRAIQQELFHGSQATGEHARCNVVGDTVEAVAESDKVQVRVPLSEIQSRRADTGIPGGFVQPGLVHEPGEDVESNVLAAGMATGMAAAQAGCNVAATVRAAAEGAAAAAAVVKASSKDKRTANKEYDVAYKRRRQAESDAKLERSVDKMAEVSKLWNDTPPAVLSRRVSQMRVDGKITPEEALLILDYFIATDKETGFTNFFAGMMEAERDGAILTRLKPARAWEAKQRAMLEKEKEEF